MQDPEGERRELFERTDPPAKVYCQLLGEGHDTTLAYLADPEILHTPGQLLAAAAVLMMNGDRADEPLCQNLYDTQTFDDVTRGLRRYEPSLPELALAVASFDKRRVGLTPLGRRPLPMMGRDAYGRREQQLRLALHTYDAGMHGRQLGGHAFDSVLLTAACDLGMQVDASPNAPRRTKTAQRRFVLDIAHGLNTPPDRLVVTRLHQRYLNDLKRGKEPDTLDQITERRKLRRERDARYMRFLSGPPSVADAYVDPRLDPHERLARWTAMTSWAIGGSASAEALAPAVRGEVATKLAPLRRAMLVHVSQGTHTLAELQAVIDAVGLNQRFSIFSKYETEGCQAALLDFVQRLDVKKKYPRFSDAVVTAATRALAETIQKHPALAELRNGELVKRVVDARLQT